MAVFPESMNKLDLANPEESLRTIENYIRYMSERVEFSNRNITRNVSDAGMSSVEILLLLNDMASALSIVNSTVNGMTGEITTLNNRVTEVQSKQTEMDTKITELQASITDLTGRVAALEAGTEG
jgi:peptidoglycan hydrolase CwlO-like protein